MSQECILASRRSLNWKHKQLFFACFSKKRIDSFHYTLEKPQDSLHTFMLPPVKIPDAQWWHFRQQGSDGRNYLRSLGSFWHSALRGCSQVIPILSDAVITTVLLPLFAIECGFSIQCEPFNWASQPQESQDWYPELSSILQLQVSLSRRKYLLVHIRKTYTSGLTQPVFSGSIFLP